jgi:hypothetical protein
MLFAELQKVLARIICLVAISTSFEAVGQQSAIPEWKQKVSTYADLSNRFKNPPPFYSPHMFWFWDTELDAGLIRQQAKDMVSKHINPGYVHARGEYFWDFTLPSMPKKDWLTDRWFNCFQGALDDTEASGYNMSFDSEYMWPSGQAGGRVIEKHPELKAKTLYYTRQELWGPWKVHLSEGAFSTIAKLGAQGLQASTLKVVAENGEKTIDVPAGKWILYTYRPDFHAGYDGGEVNYLDPKTVDRFLNIAEKPYLDRFKNQAGKTMAGVYPDHEGDFGWGMAWSEYLPKRFLEMKGKDIRSILPLLTERDAEGQWVKARCDWFEVVSDIYSKDYWGKMSAYNEKHSMYTVTNLWESPLMLVAQTVGDIMKLNRYVTMPGVDQLGYKNQDVLDYKETQTVSELEDKPLMAEVLTWVGWQQTPNDMKACTNAATAFGVTHHVPHCITTNRDMGLTQYPADFYTQNPYWQYIDQWADYTKRAAYVTRMTKLNADVLLLNPIESVWAYNEPYFQKMTQPNYFFWDRDPDWNKDARRVDSVYARCMREMADNNLDFLIGDTYYMNEAKAAANGSFVIKNHEFKLIVVPEMLVMSHSTAKKLLELAKKNVPIVIVSNLASSSPEKGFNDQELQTTLKQLLSNKSVVDLRNQSNAITLFTSTVKGIISPKISFEGKQVPLFFAHRTFGKKHFYWIANKSGEKISTSFRLKYGEGQAQRWDSENGAIKPISYKKDPSGSLINYNFEPFEGFWIVFDDQLAPAKEALKANLSRPIKGTISLSPTWTISSDTSFHSQVTGAIEVSDLKDDRELSLDNSLSRISVLGKSPAPGKFWKIRIPLNAEKVSISGLKDGVFYIDGKAVESENDVISIPQDARHLFISTSNNTNPTFINKPLLFTCTGKTKSGLKNWSEYGLYQYTGFLYYENEFSLKDPGKAVQLDLGDVKYMAEVWVNDRLVGSRLWAPFAFDISQFVRQGSNKVKIRVGNLYLNESSVNEDLNLFMYKKIRAATGMNKPIRKDFDAAFLGPVKLNLY